MEIDGPLARVKDLPDNLTATRTRGPLGSAFDRVRIINLRRRGDRRAETLRELVALGESVDGHRLGFFDAVDPDDAGGFPSPGVHGCYLSHLAVLEAAADDNVHLLLVMEDDVAFVRDAGGMLRLYIDGGCRAFEHVLRTVTPDEIIDRIEAVGIEDILRIADATVDPDSISLTLLGNLDEPGVTVEDLRGAEVERLCLSVPAHRAVQHAQVVQAGSVALMLFTEGLTR